MKSTRIEKQIRALYLTPQELCRRYRGRIAPGTLANWRSAGTGPKYIKAGGRVLYPLVAVQSWEKRQVRA